MSERATGEPKGSDSGVVAMKATPELTLLAMIRMSLGLGYTMLSVRLLGSEHYGQFSLVLSISIMFLFSYTGMHAVVINRLVEARRLARAQQSEVIRDLLCSGLLLTLPGAVLALLSGWLTVRYIPGGTALKHVIIACALMLIAQLITGLMVAVQEGLGRVRLAATMPMVAQSLMFFLLSVFVLAGRSLGLDQFLYLVTMMFLVESLLACIVTVFKLSHHIRWRVNRPMMLSLAREGFKLQASRLVALTIDPGNKLVLNWFLGPGAVAVYDVANKLAGGLQSVFSAYGRLFLQLSRTAEQARMDSIRRAANYSWALFPLFASLIASVFVVPASGWLKLDPIDVELCFVLCVFTHWWMIVATPMFMSLMTFGAYRFIFNAQILLALASFAGAILLVPVAGVSGVFVGYLGATLINVFMVERRYAASTTYYQPSLRIAREQMSFRLSFALLLLLVPPMILARVADATQYWVASGVLALLAIGMILREPVWPALLVSLKRFPLPARFR